MTDKKVWDLGVRIFHWLLVLGMIAAWFTIEYRFMQAHAIVGYGISMLLIYRLVWGFLGSTTARFSYFICSPIAAFCYLKASLQQKARSYTGHNPAGSWMVLFMLLILFLQVLSGFFANNDLGFSGPFADWVNKTQSDQLTQWHGLNFYLILAAIWLHLVAVFFYQIVKKEPLIQAMIGGRKPSKYIGDDQYLKFVSNRVAVLVWLFSLAVILLVVL
ncbi:cytochrome b/b6 domain-containing protein [Gayadomonas joobiniege]|uniref:cytochrome b/b6 domain-containing protein n=1 Tax=Gayadomonas joobiniege TaxID=1234606 RepID=UPI00035E3462|nr:cytochrome b/b6 domain-containing protein [Gayadomonas joobiniege]